MTSANQPFEPFREDNKSDDTDKSLVSSAVGGSRDALEQLIKRHQPWIYNIAFRMVMVHEEAEDVTQEILIKLITKLTTYDPTKAAFRTWLYRVVANHVINMKKRGYEQGISNIEEYYGFVTQIPDQDPEVSPDTDLLISDLKIGCVMGTLLCLERTQRLAFILALAFNVSSAQGGEILNMSREAFRKTLSRARGKLHEYVSGNCSVVHPGAKCSCRKKISAFTASGAYSVDRISFYRDSSHKVASLVTTTANRFEQEVYPEYASLLKEHPFYESRDITNWLKELLERKEFKEIFRLS